MKHKPLILIDLHPKLLLEGRLEMTFDRVSELAHSSFIPVFCENSPPIFLCDRECSLGSKSFFFPTIGFQVSILLLAVLRTSPYNWLQVALQWHGFMCGLFLTDDSYAIQI